MRDRFEHHGINPEELRVRGMEAEARKAEADAFRTALSAITASAALALVLLERLNKE